MEMIGTNPDTGSDLGPLGSALVLGPDLDLTKTPLILAAARGWRPLVKTLLSRGCDVNKDVGDGRTALHFAILRNDADMVSDLLDAGANPNLHERLGEPFPLIATALPPGENGRGQGERVLRMLIKAGASVDTPNFYMTTPLHQAAKMGSLGCVEALISAGVRLDPLESWGHTPLILAISERHTSTAHALIKAGSDVNIRDQFSRTALHYACRRGMVDTVRELLKSGADPDIRDTKGNTPLVESVFHGLNDLIFLLIMANCDVTVRAQCLQLSWKHISVLQVALARQHACAVRLLCAAGCPVTMETMEGYGRIYPHGENPEVDSLLLRTLRNPRTLSEVCRLKVRATLGRKVTDKVKRLPLPLQIQNYLTLSDITDLVS